MVEIPFFSGQKCNLNVKSFMHKIVFHSSRCLRLILFGGKNQFSLSISFFFLFITKFDELGENVSILSTMKIFHFLHNRISQALPVQPVIFFTWHWPHSLLCCLAEFFCDFKYTFSFGKIWKIFSGWQIFSVIFLSLVVASNICCKTFFFFANDIINDKQRPAIFPC